MNTAVKEFTNDLIRVHLAAARQYEQDAAELERQHRPQHAELFFEFARGRRLLAEIEQARLNPTEHTIAAGVVSNTGISGGGQPT